jgi:hypothetical protein
MDAKMFTRVASKAASGYAMELRTRFARTTKDIDLTLYDGGSHHGAVPHLDLPEPRTGLECAF